MFFLASSQTQAFEAPSDIKGAQIVSAFELLSLLQSNPDLALVDVRNSTSHRRFRSIPGSTLIPFGVGYDSSKQIKRVQARWPNTQQAIAVYCNGVSCARSSVAAQAMVDAGYRNVYWFRGGVEMWRKHRLPLE